MNGIVTRLLAGVFLLCGCAAQAAVNKCTDAGGKVTYQQQPCPQDSTAGKVALREGDWTRVGTGRVEPNTAGHILWDTDLDETRIRPAGPNMLATFRVTKYNREGGHRRTPQTYYALYDCTRGMVSGPDETLEMLTSTEMQDRPRNPFLPYAEYQRRRPDLVFGEPALVAKICDNAAVGTK